MNGLRGASLEAAASRREENIGGSGEQPSSGATPAKCTHTKSNPRAPA